jgi:hypothetical protein
VRSTSRVQTVLLLVLGAVVAALGYVNWRVLQLEPDSRPAAERTTLASLATTPIPDSSPVEGRAVSDFEEIVRRPVFNASRRPFVAPEPAAREPARTPPQDMRLMGIAIDAGKKQALLRTAQQPNGRWVGEGESIDGWQLRSVRGDAATIASGQQTHELRLYPTQARPNGNRK